MSERTNENSEEQNPKEAEAVAVSQQPITRSSATAQRFVPTFSPLSHIKVSAYIRATSARYRAWKQNYRGLAPFHQKDEQDRIARCVARQGRSERQLWHLKIPVNLLVCAMSFLPPPALGSKSANRLEPLAVERLMLASTLTLALVLENQSVMQPAVDGLAKQSLRFGDFGTCPSDQDD